MSWEDIKNAWWLIGVLVVLLLTFIRYTIKINDAAKGIKLVATHEKDIAEIKAQSDKIEKEVTGLRESLDEHTFTQKGDIRLINEALLALLGSNADESPESPIAKVKNKLMQHLMDK